MAEGPITSRTLSVPVGRSCPAAGRLGGMEWVILAVAIVIVLVIAIAGLVVPRRRGTRLPPRHHQTLSLIHI